MACSIPILYIEQHITSDIIFLISNFFLSIHFTFSLLVTEGNVFIKSSVFDNIPKSLRNFITEHLLTSHAALEQWKHYSEWYGKEMELLKEVNVSKQIPEGN